MKNIIPHIALILLLLFSCQQTLIADEKNYKIIKLVNDQVITNYDLQLRLKLYSTLNNVKISKDNIDFIAKDMLSLMVDEKLQFEQIKKYKISVDNSDIENYIKQAYLGDDKSKQDLIFLLETNDLNIDILIKSIKIKLGWNKLASNLYYRTSEISKIDLENEMSKNPSLSEKKARNILLSRQINLRAKKFLRDIKTEANIENR
tara:strand:+ start:694 stop:1305 length:612 start_codon:yes stop_codon:yes gene_type:complete